MPDWIKIKGARQHNLKNIDVAIPRGKLVVITGPSGAGKSSLAFDTLYAEGQRRYVESLSPGARQFLNQLEKPDVDAVEGLSPAIAIEQRAGGSGNPRSTVGTVTEIYDHLRLLFARVGKPHCFKCGMPISRNTVQEVVDAAMGRKGKLMVLAPLIHDPKLDFAERMRHYQREGFVRVKVGKEVFLLEEGVAEPKRKKTKLALVVDRLNLKEGDKQRLTEAVETAFRYGDETMTYSWMDEGSEETFSRLPRCKDCHVSYPEPHPRQFSFNSPAGACTECHGLGREMMVDVELVVPDSLKNLAEGAIAPWEKKNSASFHQMLEQVAEHYGFSIFTPFKELKEGHQQVLLQGSGAEELAFSYEGDSSSYRYNKTFEGVVPNLERRFRETESASVRKDIRRYMVERECTTCLGERLGVEGRHYFIGSHILPQVVKMSLDEAEQWCVDLTLGAEEAQVAEKLLDEVRARLGFLRNVGLEYLSLDRGSDTLSSGENQRIRLATQIGSALSGVIYILDEPTIGLHQRDTERLLGTLKELKAYGNTVVVVEHDRDTMLAADYLIEIGPQAGEEGGNLVAQGTPEELVKKGRSITAKYLSGLAGVALPHHRRPLSWQKLILKGASGHNLKNLDLEIPLGVFTCVTGVSGSGKSTLVLNTLYPALTRYLLRKTVAGEPLESLEGHQYLERVVCIDQLPIGRSSRSNPGTYLGVFNLIRDHFSQTPEARARGYSPSRFSFNVDGGRCEVCQGEGAKRIEMHFLPDVFVRCDACEGTRYNRETLEIRYRGKNINDILQLTLTELEQFFRAIPAIRIRLQPMLDVGLGYLRLGQSANTLSGGEAQRLKIARELGRKDVGHTLYILDEPTTGLHFEDVERLVGVLNQLVSGGNSVLVIEHNLDVIKNADYVIDMGPEAGVSGGYVVAQGTPEELLAHVEVSHTARFLKPYLEDQVRNDKNLRKKEGVLHIP